MRPLYLIFLASTLLFSSGYKWRCYIACNEMTSVQNDYVEERDQCREYAQENLDREMQVSQTPDSPKARQSKLVALFSQCMGRFGWDVPSGEKKFAADTQPPIYTTAVAKEAPVPIEQKEIKPLISRPKALSCKVPSGNAKKIPRKKKQQGKCDNYSEPAAATSAATAKPTPAKAAAPQPAPVALPPAAVPAPPVPAPVAPAIPAPVAPAQVAPVPPPVPIAPIAPLAPVAAPMVNTPPAIPAAAAEPPLPEQGLPTLRNNSDPAVDLLDSQLKPSMWR